MDARSLFRPPTQDENLADAAEEAEAAEAARGHSVAAGFAAAQEVRADARGGGDSGNDSRSAATSMSAATPTAGTPAATASAPAATPTGDDGADEQGADVPRVEYRPAYGWEESELAARRALAERLAARRAAAPAEREPVGMDKVLRKTEAIEWHDVAGEKVRV